MSTKKRTLVILASLIGTPVLFYIFGGIAGSFYPHEGSEWGVALPWVVLGILSMIVSLVAGPIVSFMIRNKTVKPIVSLLGYIVPPAIALIVCVIATIATFSTV